MVTRSTAWPEGTPCWVDLAVDDLEKAHAFYAGLFGWELEVGGPETGSYTMCKVDGKAVAGIGTKMGVEQPTVWTTYLAVDDVEKTAHAVTEAGGQVIAEPFDVMDYGRMAVAVDPVGGAFGLWQSGQHHGAELANENWSLTWNEHMSRDLDAAKSFYTTVFGYTYQDVPDDTPYAMVQLKGEVVGGLGVMGPEAPAAMPAHWRTYFLVPDVDATIAKVTELGGQALGPAFDSEYGRMAMVCDDQGAMFFVIKGS